jgi:exopolysaccharide biosynthesis polyprenyl glycosylphosphotransferase
MLVGPRSARLAVLDALLTLLALFLAGLSTNPNAGINVVEGILLNWTGAVLLALSVQWITYYIFELYNLRLDFCALKNIVRCIAAVTIAGTVVAIASFAVPMWGFSRALFLSYGVLAIVFTVGSRYLWSKFDTERLPSTRVLLVTVGPIADEIVEEFFHNPESALRMVGSIPVQRTPLFSQKGSLPPAVGSIQDCETALERENAHELIVAGLHRLPDPATRELLRLKGKGIEVHDLADLYQDLTGRIPLDLIDDLYFLREPSFTRDTQPRLSNLLRVLDVISSLVLLVLSSPLWLFAAIGIKLTMPGPVLYSQERVGKDEKPYTIYKFRSMRMDAEKDGPQWSAGPVDQRVTRFGRILRRTRVDELPQLLNVLAGDMSLVGPRPERAVFVEQLKRDIPYYGLRFQVKPGLTGWAQVNFRYGASVDDTRVKLSFDLFYVQHRSVPLFLLTLVKTVTTVLFKPGS